MIDTDEVEVPSVEEGRETLFDLVTDTVTSYPTAVAGVVLVLIVVALVKALGGAAAGVAGQFRIVLGVLVLAALAFAIFAISR